MCKYQIVLNERLHLATFWIGMECKKAYFYTTYIFIVNRMHFYRDDEFLGTIPVKTSLGADIPIKVIQTDN